jgi:hypothetical protein
MHTVPTLTAGSIASMTAKQDRPVYFLTLQGQPTPTITVKGDSIRGGSEVSILWTARLMKHVNDPQVNTKIMTGQEIGVFMTAARQYLPAGSNGVASLAGRWRWVKMPFVPGLSDAGFLDQPEPATAKMFKQLVRKLAIRDTWYQLGKVIAVDMFNGNYDRFDYDGTWVNRGNLMFQQLDGLAGIKVVGLDTFDPTSEHSNLTQSGAFSELNVLRNTDLDFAKKVTASVTGRILLEMRRAGMESVTVSIKDPSVPAGTCIVIKAGVNAFLGFSAELQRGITDGARTLKAYLVDKVKQYAQIRPAIGSRAPIKQIPPGITARMRYLGWIA